MPVLMAHPHEGFIHTPFHHPTCVHNTQYQTEGQACQCLEQWHADALSMTQSSSVRPPYRYTTPNRPPETTIEWNAALPVPIPASVPQAHDLLAEQWWPKFPATNIPLVSTDENNHDFNPLETTYFSHNESPLPLRTQARAPLVYEGYDSNHDLEDYQSIWRRRINRRANTASSSSRAHTDQNHHLSRPRSSREMASRSTSQPHAGGTSSSHAAAQAEERQFACDRCPARFARKRDRDRHERSVHTGQTPYHCLGCGEGFVRSDARGRHWKADPSCHSKHLSSETSGGPGGPSAASPASE